MSSFGGGGVFAIAKQRVIRVDAMHRKVANLSYAESLLAPASEALLASEPPLLLDSKSMQDPKDDNEQETPGIFATPLIKRRMQAIDREEAQNLNAALYIKSLPPSKVEEAITLIHANIETGHMGRAEILFHTLWRRNPSTMAWSTNAEVLNAFISGWARVGDVPSAMEWFASFDEFRELIAVHGGTSRRDPGDSGTLLLAPNSRTFAILIDALSKNGDRKGIQTIVQRLLDDGLDLDSVFHIVYHDSPTTARDLHAILVDLNYSVSFPAPPSADPTLASLLHSQSQSLSQSQSRSSPSDPGISQDEIDSRLPSVDTTTLLSLTKTLSILAKDLDTRQKQSLLEKQCYDNAVDELMQLRKQGHALPTSVPKALIQSWHASLVPSLQSKIDEYRAVVAKSKPSASAARTISGEGDVFALGPFLTLPGLGTEKISLITITEVLKKYWNRDSSGEIKRYALYPCLSVRWGYFHVTHSH